jgi:hypothetical protein
VQQTIKPGEFLKAVPIEKVDEAKQEAWGTFTAEVRDSDNEIADYAYQKGRVQAWSDNEKSIAAAAGMEESLGNVRFSHMTLPTGKVIALNMDDGRKTIGGGTYLMNVGDTKTWDMVAKGILKGFSFGGRYDWRKCDVCGEQLPNEQGNNWCPACKETVPVRYGATIAELSVCDRPAVPVANILHIKADGSTVPVEVKVDKDEKKTKRVAGEDLTADCFAHVGDPEKTETWKLPIKFSTEEKTKRHIVNALARFASTKGIPADEKAKVKAKIIAAAKEHGIEVSEDEDKAEVLTLDRSFIKAESQRIKESIHAKAAGAGITLRKDLFDVANFAEVLQRIAWLRYSAIQERDYEGDESDIPEELEENLISLSETFLRMAQEETAELVAAAKKAGKVTTMKKEVELPENVGDVMTGHLVDQAAHNEVLADAHKAMAEHHTAQAAVHKAAHEHFKKAAADGGEHEEHHKMHADIAKATHEHHLAKAEHHTAMHKAHSEMAAKCAKCAEDFADTPEKKTALAAQFKTVREAKPAIRKSNAAPVEVDVTNMSEVEKNAYARIQGEYYASPEYAKKVRESLDAQAVAKLNAAANNASIAVGVEAGGDNGNIYAVPRAGQLDKSQQDEGELTGATKLFDFIK